MGCVKLHARYALAGYYWPPRFYMFLTVAAQYSANYRHVNVVELHPGGRLPRTIRSKEVKQILLRTEPLHITHAVETYARAEKALNKLDHMALSLQVADLEEQRGEPGVKNLWDKLWTIEMELENEQQLDICEPRASKITA